MRGTLAHAPTLSNYGSAWAAFTTFASRTGTPLVPHSWQTAAFALTTFMRNELNRGIQVSTVRSYASGVKYVWQMNLGKDPLEGSPIPDIFASAAAALKPDPSDGHSLPFPASWLPALLHHSAEPWEAPAVVMAFIFMWRRSNYCRHYSPSAKALVDRLLVKHVSTPPGSIQVHLVKDKNVDAASQHRRSATGSALCPRQLYMTYAATRPSSLPDAPAFQRPNGDAVTSDDVTRTLQRIASSHGACPPNLQRYKPHSLRKGGAVASRALGYDLAWLLREGRWRNILSIEPYIRELAEHNCAGHMQRLLPNVFGTRGAPV